MCKEVIHSNSCRECQGPIQASFPIIEQCYEAKLNERNCLRPNKDTLPVLINDNICHPCASWMSGDFEEQHTTTGSENCGRSLFSDILEWKPWKEETYTPCCEECKQLTLGKAYKGNNVHSCLSRKRSLYTSASRPGFRNTIRRPLTRSAAWFDKSKFTEKQREFHSKEEESPRSYCLPFSDTDSYIDPDEYPGNRSRTRNWCKGLTSVIKPLSLSSKHKERAYDDSSGYTPTYAATGTSAGSSDRTPDSQHSEGELVVGDNGNVKGEDLGEEIALRGPDQTVSQSITSQSEVLCGRSSSVPSIAPLAERRRARILAELHLNKQRVEASSFRVRQWKEKHERCRFNGCRHPPTPDPEAWQPSLVHVDIDLSASEFSAGEECRRLVKKRSEVEKWLNHPEFSNRGEAPWLKNGPWMGDSSEIVIKSKRAKRKAGGFRNFSLPLKKLDEIMGDWIDELEQANMIK